MRPARVRSRPRRAPKSSARCAASHSGESGQRERLVSPVGVRRLSHSPVAQVSDATEYLGRRAHLELAEALPGELELDPGDRGALEATVAAPEGEPPVTALGVDVGELVVDPGAQGRGAPAPELKALDPGVHCIGTLGLGLADEPGPIGWTSCQPCRSQNRSSRFTDHSRPPAPRSRSSSM